MSSRLLSENLKIRIYKTIILPVVLYCCETWSLTLREKHRLRVFENRVLRWIFELKRDEVMGEWWKLHSELRDLYSLPSIIRIIKSRTRWGGGGGHVAQMGEKRNVYRLLVGKPTARKTQDVDGWILLGYILERWDGMMWSGLVWLRIGTGGELL
jgi:hypothetical protein